MLDPLIIIIALGCGFLARFIGLPPLIGYLAAGFVLHETDIQAGELLSSLADLGITLLLFTIGLKLSPGELLQARVWGTTVIHMALLQLFFTALLLVAGMLLPDLGLELSTALLVAFALTFSSTVFVIQVMQAKGEMSSRHAELAIGILIIQDLAAVIFLAFTQGKLPHPEAFLLLALWPARGILMRLLSMAGHGELFTLCGFAIAIGGAQLFEWGGIKGDLGALLLGALFAGHQKSKELVRVMVQFKDVFLVCFFLTIGLQGWPSQSGVILALLLGMLALLKPLLYFPLMTLLHTPPRTALLASSVLGNYSEFGLVVIAVAASSGMVDSQWSSTLSLAIALSFLLSSPLSRRAHGWYLRYHDFWRRFESHRVRKAVPDTSGARVVVLGMGNIGTNAYDAIAEVRGEEALGVDLNEAKLEEHSRKHRRVVIADASDPDFWHRVSLDEVELILLALTQHQENMLVGTLLRELGYGGQVAVVVRFAEEAEELREHGFSAFNLYAQAGAGFAAHALERITPASAL
ncbi:MAG: cation:proton antiporter family protein [Halioglobus sp.]|nr:cation:proton antiporter family protein [Halioglobus sp.]